MIIRRSLGEGGQATLYNRRREIELSRMCNLAAEIFRIEKSDTLRAAIPPFVSFLNWTGKAGPEQDSLRRAVKVWFTRAQKPAKIIEVNDLDDGMSPEEIEPMLSERIERWSKELIQQGKVEGEAKGRAEGRVEGQSEGEAKGEVKGIQKVARNMLQKGMSVSDISEVTGLSEQEILSLTEANGE